MVAQVLVALPGLTTVDGGVDPALAVVTAPVALLTAAALFGLVVPRGGWRSALTLAGLALASLPLFRIGLTAPLAAAGLVVARGVPEREPGRAGQGLLALLLALAALALLAWFGLIDAIDLVNASRARQGRTG